MPVFPIVLTESAINSERTIAMQFSGVTSLYPSVPVPLKAIDSDQGSDTEFPRLDALEYKEDTSKFLIKVLNSPVGITLLDVAASDAVADVKRRVIRLARARELTKIKYEGDILDEGHTLLSCGITSGSEISVEWPEGEGKKVQQEEKKRYEEEIQGKVEEDVAQGKVKEDVARDVDISFEAERRNLVNKARARVLYDWNGLTSDGEMLGLPLRSKEFVMIGRVVNKDWYEGYLPNDMDKSGYIPRNYVEIESLYDEAFRQCLGPAAQGLPLSPQAPRPSRPHRKRRDCLDKIIDPVMGILSSKKHKQKQVRAATDFSIQSNGNVPPVPPSPFPRKPPVPTLDLLEQGTRLRLNFQVKQDNAEEYPTLIAVLSLVSAPQSRVSYATVELAFEHDTIVHLEPKREEGLATEVHHNKSVTNELSATGGVNQGPAGVNITGSRTVSKVAEFSRRTRGTVVGDGEGSSKAYWVFTEDPGEAGRFGLDSEQVMLVKLHARPVRVDYQVNAKVVTDDGGKGGWFGTKRLSSGRQRFYLCL